MKKLSLSIASFCLLVSTSIFAQQDWVKMMQSGNANLKDVRASFYKWYSTHKPEADDDKDAVKGEEHETDGNYLLFRRWEWLMQKSTDASGKLPDMAVIGKEYQDFLSRQNKKSTHQVEATASWSYAGNTNVPSGGDVGRVNRLRFDPNNSNIVYACSPSGGLWKSTNGGTGWTTAMTDHLLAIGTSDVAIDPANSNIMYLATGDDDGIDGIFETPSTIGVLKSTDGGATWQQTSLNYTLQNSGPSRIVMNEIIINPKNTNVILTASTNGLYYSDNAGISWTMVQSGNIKSVEFEPGNPQVVYASSASAGFYRSTNGGLSFTAITLPSVSGSGRMQIGVTPAAANYVYVVADNATNYAFKAIWLSTDTGKTFTLQASTPNLLGFYSGTGSDATSGQGWYTLSIAVSPTSATTVFVGGVNIWKSTNSGTSWTRTSSWTGGGGTYVHADIHNITFLPGSSSTLFAGDDGGVHKSTSTGSSWTDIGSGLEISQQYSIGLSGSNSTEWITGWQDNGTNLANSGAWSEPLGGDGMMCFIDYSNNNYMYGEQYDGSFNMSSNGGASWNGITNGLTETGAWVTPWLLDPQNSSTLIAGLSNVWKSTNRGTNWTKISTFGNGTSTLTAVAVAPSNDQYIYALGNGALYGTTDGGTTWNNVTGNLPAGSATNLTVDPANPQRVWVTVGGFSSGQKVYQSVTGGTTWTNISNGLPNLPVLCIAYQGAGKDGMYVGTYVGVYYRDTTNTGGDWVAYNTGLPNVIVCDLKIYAPGSILRAATYGRGTWQISLYQPSASAPVADFTAFPTKPCAGNTVQFTDTSSNQPTSWKWRFTGGTPDTSSLQNPVITYNTAGTYPVTETVSNSAGKDSITVTKYITVNPLPATPTIVQNADTLSCSPANYTFYQWIFKGAAVPNATGPKLVINAKGVYRVDVSDSNGCAAYGQLVVSTIVSGINEISLNDYINVYPNPTSGNLQVYFNIPNDGQYELSISNVLGQTMYTNTIHLAGQSTQNIDMSGFSKGVYFLSIKGPNSKGVKKIMLY